MMTGPVQLVAGQNVAITSDAESRTITLDVSAQRSTPTNASFPNASAAFGERWIVQAANPTAAPISLDVYAVSIS